MTGNLHLAETRPATDGGPAWKSVSPLGLGTVKFGRNQNVKYPGGGGFAMPTDSEIEALLDLALECGINLLDTAPAYGTPKNGWESSCALGATNSFSSPRPARNSATASPSMSSPPSTPA